jgi:hypothetical protein
MMGTFDSVLPTLAARTSLEKLLAWIADRHGLNPTGSHTYVNPVLGTSKWLPTIAGHRDVNQTDCPGAALYPYLATIRKNVAARIAATTGPTHDQTAPTVRSLTSLATTPTGASKISFGLIFSEPVTGLTAADFAVSGTSPGWAVSAISGRAATYTVTVASSAPTDGSVVLTLPAGAVADLAAHSGPAGAAAATAQFAVDTTAPSVVLYATKMAAKTTPWNYVVTVTFSEPVVGLTAANLTIGGTSNAASHWTVDPVVGSGAHYGFSIHHDNPPNGTLTLAIGAGKTKDAAGNPNLASAVKTIYVDRAAPTVSGPIGCSARRDRFGCGWLERRRHWRLRCQELRPRVERGRSSIQDDLLRPCPSGGLGWARSRPRVSIRSASQGLGGERGRLDRGTDGPCQHL